MSVSGDVQVPVVRLDADLPLPSYARAGDAGIDLLARHGGLLPHGGGRMLVPTGLAIAIPTGYAGLVLPRSGLALKHGVTVMNAPGLIDAGYRDELKVILVNTDPAHDFELQRGDRIAQLVILPVPTIAWHETDALDGENRGGGFGHTGR